MSEDKPINIDSPINSPDSSPFILFQLYDLDDGNTFERTIKPNFLNRSPISILWFDDRLQLCITNLGAIASDLIEIDHEFRTCVDPLHLVDEGFTHDHFGEINSKLSESKMRLDFLPAAEGPGGANLVINIALPALPANIANLYFRAKASTLWTKPVPKAKWNFASDRMGVESTKRYVP